jgi:hypothetical protein
MAQYVALVADMTGRYAHVLVNANTWDNAIGQLEDAGCEVVENQTDDYEVEDFKDKESMQEVGLWSISELISKTNFVSYN